VRLLTFLWSRDPICILPSVGWPLHRCLWPTVPRVLRCSALLLLPVLLVVMVSHGASGVLALRQAQERERFFLAQDLALSCEERQATTLQVLRLATCNLRLATCDL